MALGMMTSIFEMVAKDFRPYMKIFFKEHICVIAKD
jgi:hypothetical protein